MSTAKHDKDSKLSDEVKIVLLERLKDYLSSFSSPSSYGSMNSNVMDAVKRTLSNHDTSLDALFEPFEVERDTARNILFKDLCKQLGIGNGDTITMAQIFSIVATNPEMRAPKIITALQILTSNQCREYQIRVAKLAEISEKVDKPMSKMDLDSFTAILAVLAAARRCFRYYTCCPSPGSNRYALHASPQTSDFREETQPLKSSLEWS